MLKLIKQVREMRILFFCFLLLTIQSCRYEEKVARNPNLVTFTGTITYQQLEGGFWGIIGKEGEKYNPVNLPADFKKEGLRVRVIALPKKDMVSIRMWGTIIEIKEIALYDPEDNHSR